MSSMSDIEVLAINAGKEAVRQYKKEEQQQQRKGIKHNTSVLLNHYLDLKSHFARPARFKMLMEEDAQIIEAVKRSKFACKMLLVYVNNSLDKLKTKFPEKFRAIDLLYMNEDMAEFEWADRKAQVCAAINVSESTLDRWRKDMESELAVVLFGPHGLKIWTL